MEIVINIPDEYHRNLLRNCRFSSEEIPVVSLAVAAGTILPKDHGRLIDADALKQRYVARNSDSPFDKSWISTVRRTINDAPTIIEEGKESR